MRFLAAMLLVLLFAVSMAGCGGDKPAQSQAASASPSASVLASEQPAPAGTASAAPMPPGESPAPSPTEDLQGESKQALDDLNQALKELDDMNSDNTSSQNAIDGLN